MGKSTRIRLSDVRSVYRIVSEIIELGADPEIWRPHLAMELIQFFDLQMGGVYVMPISLDVADANVSKISLCGLDETATRMWMEYGKQGDLSSDPCTPAIMKIIAKGFSATRQMFVDDQTWYRSAYYNEFKRAMRCDDILLSILPIPQLGIMHGMHGDRREGQKQMGRREAVCLSLIHQELGRRWNRYLSHPAAVMKRLPPRLTELLNYMRGPHSEKEIAQLMKLSPHTVHNHVRRLYARFNVASRFELMAIDRNERFNGVPSLGVGGL